MRVSLPRKINIPKETNDFGKYYSIMKRQKVKVD